MRQPNIIVIMCDQLKATASHLYGNSFCETPHLGPRDHVFHDLNQVALLHADDRVQDIALPEAVAYRIVVEERRLLEPERPLACVLPGADLIDVFDQVSSIGEHLHQRGGLQVPPFLLVELFTMVGGQLAQQSTELRG